MNLEMRPIDPDEFPRFHRAANIAFGETATEAEVEAERGTFEFDRSLGVFDGSEIVATAGAYTFQLTLPGLGQVPAGGVSYVTVLPTHRRRGILTSIMRRQFSDFADRGEPVAVLTASESNIYGRLGSVVPSRCFASGSTPGTAPSIVRFRLPVGCGCSTPRKRAACCPACTIACV